jgi:hypothetical protein
VSAEIVDIRRAKRWDQLLQAAGCSSLEEVREEVKAARDRLLALGRIEHELKQIACLHVDQRGAIRIRPATKDHGASCELCGKPISQPIPRAWRVCPKRGPNPADPTYTTRCTRRAGHDGDCTPRRREPPPRCVCGHTFWSHGRGGCVGGAADTRCGCKEARLA